MIISSDFPKKNFFHFFFLFFFVPCVCCCHKTERAKTPNSNNPSILHLTSPVGYGASQYDLIVLLSASCSHHPSLAVLEMVYKILLGYEYASRRAKRQG